jgi:clan AA aspartic protease
MRNMHSKSMGEVHVRVRLTNAADVAMAEKGLLAIEEVRSCDVDAIVDTGATRSVIPADIAARLGLRARREGVVTLADGGRITAGTSEPIYFEIYGREVAEEAYILGDAVLIGQTILELTDLLVDCTNRKVIPNPAHPDGPVLRV